MSEIYDKAKTASLIKQAQNITWLLKAETESLERQMWRVLEGSKNEPVDALERERTTGTSKAGSVGKSLWHCQSSVRARAKAVLCVPRAGAAVYKSSTSETAARSKHRPLARLTRTELGRRGLRPSQNQLYYVVLNLSLTGRNGRCTA